MTFESWKAWWDYLKSTAANVMSKAHQNLSRRAGKLPLATSSPFPRGSTSPSTDVFKVGPDEAGSSGPIWHKQMGCCLITWVNVSAPGFAAYLATLDLSPVLNMPTVFPQSYLKTFFYHGRNGAAL